MIGDHKLVIIPREHADFFEVEVSNMRTHLIEEIAIVRNYNHRSIITLKKVFQPVTRSHVQVVGRFVEQKNVGLSKENLGEQNPEFPTPL